MSPPPAPPPFSLRADGGRLLALVFLSFAVHGWLVFTAAVTAIDSVGFARYALALEDPQQAGLPEKYPRTVGGVLRDQTHPPGYPAAVLLMSKVVRAVWVAPLPDQMLLSAQLASALAGVLLVFPVYWLGRLLFDQAIAFRSALLLQLLPVFARSTSDGLTDGPFLLFALAAVAVGVWATTRNGWWPHLLAGGLAGLAYLIRPEGVVAVAAVAASVLLRAVRRELPFGRAAGLVAVAVAGFVLVGGAYMLAIGGFTNKPALAADPEQVVRGAGGPLFARTLTEKSTGAVRAVEVAGLLGEEWLKVGHWGVAVYAIIGLACLLRRVMREPRFWPAVLYAGGHLAVLAVLGFKKGYVSERHLLPVMGVGVLFAVGGLPTWFALWAKVPAVGPLFRWRGWPLLCWLAMLTSCIVFSQLFARRLHDDRAGHREAGHWLANELKHDPPDVVVFDHYQLAQYYSGRAVRAVPQDPPVQRVYYVVLEFKEYNAVDAPKVPEENRRRHTNGVQVYNLPPDRADVAEVYRWPEDPDKPRRIALFKVTPK